MDIWLPKFQSMFKCCSFKPKQVLIRHLYQLKTVVFLHWCLICALLFQKFWNHYSKVMAKDKKKFRCYFQHFIRIRVFASRNLELITTVKSCVTFVLTSVLTTQQITSKVLCLGATTFSIMTLSMITLIIITFNIMTFSIMRLFNDIQHDETQHNDNQHNDIQHDNIQPNDILQSETQHNDN